jgi:hypothetical protein
MKSFETISMVAGRRKVSHSAVRRVIDALSMCPATRFGNVNAYTPDQVRKIEAELDRIAARKEPQAAAPVAAH